MNILNTPLVTHTTHDDTNFFFFFIYYFIVFAQGSLINVLDASTIGLVVRGGEGGLLQRAARDGLYVQGDDIRGTAQAKQKPYIDRALDRRIILHLHLLFTNRALRPIPCGTQASTLSYIRRNGLRRGRGGIE